MSLPDSSKEKTESAVKEKDWGRGCAGQLGNEKSFN